VQNSVFSLLCVPARGKTNWIVVAGGQRYAAPPFSGSRFSVNYVFSSTKLLSSVQVPDTGVIRKSSKVPGLSADLCMATEQF
jgi:hypothetical protein